MTARRMITWFILMENIPFLYNSLKSLNKIPFAHFPFLEIYASCHYFFLKNIIRKHQKINWKSFKFLDIGPREMTQFSCWKPDGSSFLEKKLQIQNLQSPCIWEVMLGKDIKLTRLGLWGRTCAPKYTAIAFQCVLCLHRVPLAELFSKKNFWCGSNPEKGKKKR